MNDPVSRHPGAETMAAFVEGKLAPGDVAEVATHLRGCAECRTVTGGAARFEEEEQARARKPRLLAGWRGWAAAAAAALAAILASIPLLRPATALAPLIAASPREYRTVNGRLSGFPWARLQGEARGASESPADDRLRGAAHTLLSETRDDDAVEARHAAGVAYLLIDQNADSLEKLARAADESKDAHVWNDLAAARFTVAVRGVRADLLAPALAAADRAIELDPELVDAYFNRALILEQLKTRDAARKAWERYLELDPSSEWSNEAREHLRALGNPSAAVDFTKELARAAGNRDAILALVRRFPQEARVTGEGLLLGEWADAYVANDAACAEEKLAIARTIAGELAATKGERLLFDAVRVVEERPSIALAEAHRSFRDAHDAYRKRRRVGEAAKGFAAAESAFRAAQSPMADVAELYVAKSIFDQKGDATAPLTALRARIDAKHYRALAAETDWALALQAASAADWGTAIRICAVASKTFSELGETQNTAWMDALGANALDRIGASEVAWQRRVQAIAGYADQPRRIANILHSAAVGLAAADQVGNATALMDVALATESNPELRAIILTDRARLAERAGEVADARRLLGEARGEIGRIGDTSMREMRFAQVELAEASLSCTTGPLRAIAMLDRCVEFFQQHDQGIYLADALIERARASHAARRDEAAIADYHAALHEIDRQRRNASGVSDAFFDVAARAVDESIDLHLDRGEAAAAFAIADRVHAGTRDYRPASIPEGIAVLEYATLPHAVAIFCATHDGVTAKKVPIERAALESHVLSFTRRMKAREDVRADATSLHALLIAPVASEFAGARELVIVPDRQLNALPFRALHDGSRYLIETYTVRLAPSAAAEDGRAEARPTLDVVAVIADPASDRAPRLQWSREEGQLVASIYGVPVIGGAEATRGRVSAAIEESSLVHYAGHADRDAESYGALLLARDGDDSGLLTAREIARLQLRRHPLVVLSACGTLSGRTNHVAGTPSLARAFLDAGASAVVGTLWEVDDDVASPLFVKFHEFLRAGEVPAVALRKAQIAMLQTSDPRLNHPSAWSAVEVLSNL